MKTEEVDGFFDKYLGTEALVVPTGGERLKDWPGLSGQEYALYGYDVYSYVILLAVIFF